MFEQPRSAEESTPGEGESGGTDSGSAPHGAATPPDVRDVVGRRGYDEGEDETATEDEQH